MIIKLKVKNDQNSGRKKIFLWIQRHKDFKQEIQQIMHFFKDQITISKKRKIVSYYRITSDNPALLLSMFSAVLDLIPEIYFQVDDSMEIEESI